MLSHKQRGLRRCLITAVMLTGLCTLLPAVWAVGKASVLEQPYPYVVIEQDLKDVLLELGRNLGIATQITKPVRGVVRGGTQPNETADGFLRRLGAAHDLVWFLDHDTLLVSTQQENKTESVSVTHLDAERRRQIAQEWSGKGAGVHVTLDDRSGRLLVTGPASFQERIASALAVVQKAPTPRSGMGVTVFRGSSSPQEVMVPR